MTTRSAEPLGYEQAPPPPRRSTAGIASFALAVTLLPVIVLLYYQQPSGSPSAFAAFLLLTVMVVVPGVGMTLGIRSVISPNRRRGFAVAGLTINGLFFALGLLNVVIILLDKYLM
jgi:hypothetical protein